jgi:nucleotide-binding universal stress UspA family protein
MYKRILVPLDGSVMAEQSIPHAIGLAERYGAMLILLRVLEPIPQVRGMSASDSASIKQHADTGAHEYLAKWLSKIRNKGIPVQPAVVEGRPDVTILNFSEHNQVDLIVICSRGRSGLSRWLMGSVADRVVRGAAAPVLLVRACKEAAVH